MHFWMKINVKPINWRALCSCVSKAAVDIVEKEYDKVEIKINPCDEQAEAPKLK